MPDTALQQVDGLTVKEAAFILRVAPQTVYGWCYEGKIRYFKIMGSLRIEKSAVEMLKISTRE